LKKSSGVRAMNAVHVGVNLLADGKCRPCSKA